MANIYNVRLIERILKENGMLLMSDIVEMTGFCQETIFSCFKDIVAMYKNKKTKLVRYRFNNKSYYFFGFVYGEWENE